MARLNVRDKLVDEDKLDLSCCELTDVPVKDIRALTRVTSLDLSNNQLILLSPAFVTLTHIVQLDLSKNLLTELPIDFGKLHHLKRLDLYDNKITKLPLSFGDLKNLKWLDLKSNPLTAALSEIAGPCSDSEDCTKCARLVVDYYAKLRHMIDTNRTKEEKEKRIRDAKEEAKKERKKKARKINKLNKKKNARGENFASDDVDSTHEDENSLFSTDDSQTSTGTLVWDSNSNASAREACFARRFFRTLCSIIFSFISIGIILALIIVIIPKINQDTSNKLITYVETTTGLPLKHYQQMGVEKLDSVVECGRVLMNHTRTLVKDTYERHFGEEPVEMDDADL